MDLLEAMRSTFSCRDFTDEPVPDAAIFRLLDAARFAPSGGNRQGWRVVVVRDRAVRERMAELVKPVMRRYVAETLAGEAPYNALTPSRVDDATVAKTPLPDATWRPLIDAPVVLVIALDLTRVTSFDRHLPRPGVVSGASVYPFAWNLLLAGASPRLRRRAHHLPRARGGRRAAARSACPSRSRSRPRCRSVGRSAC